MINRRHFLSGLAGSGLALSLPGILPNDKDANHRLADRNNSQSVDWQAIRKDFLVSKHELVNLNSGSSGNMPVPVLESYTRLTEELAAFAPYHVLESWTDVNKKNLERLALLLGAEDGNLAFVRNTTEAVNIILSGIAWEEEDEIITADWDYPYVEYSVGQLRERHGVRVRNINHSLPGLSNEEIIEFYRQQITDKSRLMVITWMTHREGQILPVKELIELAHGHGIEVMLDGAHIAGQLQVDLSALKADYFASSLHKWLNAPLGSGVLYIAREQVENHFPYLSYDPSKKFDASKYDYLGTRPFQNLATLGAAIDHLELTGLKAKQERLHRLSRYWIDGLSSHERIQVHTDPERCCAVASLSIADLPGGKIKRLLNEKFNVHVKSSAIHKRPVIRVSPNIYTRFEDLDRFIEGAVYIAENYQK